MEQKRFWSVAATQGGVIGLVLAASMFFETYASLSGSVGLMGLMLVEWIAVVVLHYWLLNRYTKQYAAQFSAEEGFPFFRGYGYVLVLSLFAGVILGLAQALYLHGVMGYGAYIEQYASALKELLASSPASSQMEPMLKQMFTQLEAAPVPSVLQTAWGGVTNSILFGGFFGLIIAAVQSRRPELFTPKNEE
ncbi:MAG: DUF4199 domain-containing protein [Alistipes sp.]|nr:DUF4199 domain-containing protein [Alistipes sp.]MBQ8580472.1 DUF4199 domain-containing protein [Alistipes sp.]